MIDFSKLDKVIHEKGRLSIMTLLATRVEWNFQDLKGQLQMSDGNLITHLRALEKVGFVSVYKEMNKKRPQSNYALTKTGKAAFEDYLTVLEQIVSLGKND